MGEILKYVSEDFYNSQKMGMKDGEIKVIFENNSLKIKLLKEGRKIYNVIVNYGDKPITDIARNLLLLQA